MSTSFVTKSACRKKKAAHKPASTDDKRLQSTLKRLNVNTIPGIEEVMLVKEDNATVFSTPKGEIVCVFFSVCCHTSSTMQIGFAVLSSARGCSERSLLVFA
jgi:NAC domain